MPFSFETLSWPFSTFCREVCALILGCLQGNKEHLHFLFLPKMSFILYIYKDPLWTPTSSLSLLLLMLAKCLCYYTSQSKLTGSGNHAVLLQVHRRGNLF